MKRSPISYLRLIVAASIVLVVGFAASVVWHSRRVMRSAAEDVRAENEFRVVTQALAPKLTAFEVINSPAVFLQAIQFQDHLYIAGAAGLLEYEPGGSLVRQYNVGRELPGSPLTALATAVLAGSHLPELLIATGGDGILAFNGQTFRQILPAATDARAIDAMLPTAAGHLLLGTSKRGVLIYDGKRLTVFHPTLDKLHVTALAGSDSDLWVGTLNRGVLHFHAGQTDSFTEEQGLPDPQVLSLAASGDTTFVGTATGVAVFQDGRFSRVLAPGVLTTALFATKTQLYVGSEDQGVLMIPLNGRRPNPNQTPTSELAEVHQLFASGNEIFAVAHDGLYRMSPHAFGWQRVLQESAAVLTDRNISALATDANGNLWIGYFDRGIDVLRSDSTRVRHVEDEHVFCVNRILPDTSAGIVDVATANGLVRFDNAGSEQQVLTRADGLIADHVTDVVKYRDGLALATPAGLTFLDASGARSMYAFHGLVNNHVYALAASGDQLMAGTLGGLSHLNKGDISANYTTTNSNLKHNWITAVVPVGSSWLVGTYGAGVLELDQSGRFHSLETASGDFEVNPNAMLVTPTYVLAGTLGRGLYVLDRNSQRWFEIRDGLPSLNVTALAAVNGYIYVGTDNGLVRIPEQKLQS
jgi:ligand-binding sensor domain-containing protein